MASEHRDSPTDKKPAHTDAGTSDWAAKCRTDAHYVHTHRPDMLSKLQSDYRLVRAQLTEAIMANKKWAEYDRSRDELVNSLLTKVNNLQPKVNVDPEDAAGCLDGLSITQWRARAEQEESLRLHLEAVNEHQQLFIRDLQKALHQCRTDVQPQSKPQMQSWHEDSEQIELLKNQVQVFSEDFQHERKDRERAQERISNLEEQVELLCQRLANTQAHRSLVEPCDTTTTLDAYHDEYTRQMELQQMYSPIYYQSRLIAHGTLQGEGSLTEDGDGETWDAEVSSGATCRSAGIPEEEHWRRRAQDATSSTTIITASAAAAAAAATTTSATATTTTTTTATKGKNLNLECPKCSSLFTVNDPLAFLEHTDICPA